MKKCLVDHLLTLSDDPYLAPYAGAILSRKERVIHTENILTDIDLSLEDFASGHEYFGLHQMDGRWVFREYAPNAESIHLVGVFSDWEIREPYALKRIDDRGSWELSLSDLKHGDLYYLHIKWAGGEGKRIPAYARRVVQDQQTGVFNAQVWVPENPYKWMYDDWKPADVAPVIYEAHIGMAQEKEGIGTYEEFKHNILPRIHHAGYNTIQLMALMEHPYYGSFGYHVSSFFAASSRFGTPEELKSLIDVAHGLGIRVIMDLVHSHAVKNEVEGLSNFDGTPYLYFHDGARGYHDAWDSRCFDYSNPVVLHFLLSNCRFWLDEYRVDGFRFDGITSMVYRDHGLGRVFDSYDRYFDDGVDEDAVAYLALANMLIHDVNPNAITVAEDVSGMPGLVGAVDDGGCGFDYRLAMGIPDCWFKYINDFCDQDWSMDHLWHELTNRRLEERTISYVESHDQALVGGKTAIFEMIDTDMYTHMNISDESLSVDRGMALHKMMRLITMGTAGHGYLNFIGNEFGHPEWVDFPREANGESYKHARRQWSLRDDPNLKYHYLADFDGAMLRMFRESRLIDNELARCVMIRNDNKIIVFERAGFFFFFSFHPSESVVDYQVEMPPGRYVLLMDTDEKRFGGHGRLNPGQHYFSEAIMDGDTTHHAISLYIPSRTALVLRKEDC